MKQKFIYLIVFFLSVAMLYLAGCTEKEEDPTKSNTTELEVIQINNLVADTGNTNHCSFYCLDKGMEVELIDSASDKWDVAFRKTSVFINGGSSGLGKVSGLEMDGIFDEISVAPESGYKKDSKEEQVVKDWYSYTGNNAPEHAILVVPGKVFVIKTSKGNYAKLEILSYYKDNPETNTEEFANLKTRPPSRHYTFRYVIQKDGTKTF